MNLAIVYLLTFLESAGTGILQRGTYFFTHERLGFGQLANLVAALGYGTVYVGGALASHGIATRWGERRLLTGSLFGLMIVQGALACTENAWALCTGFVLSAGLRGLKWPLLESYVSAGRTPHEVLPALARYNVSWALAMPLAVGAAGPIISSPWPFLLFAIPAGINVVSLLLVRSFPARPAYLDHAHPERPAPAVLERYRDLMISARWSLLAAYGLLFLLAPLMPEIFQRLALPIALATPAAALYDVVRVTSFIVLGRMGAAWRGRALPLAVSALLLPAGFWAVLSASSLGTVLFGELVFGGASGFVYTASLYYALVVKNAAVDAGGAHEGLIGLGLGLGPLAGIVGYALTEQRIIAGGGAFGSFAGALIGIFPLVFVCVAGSLWPMPRLLRAAA
jgi:hypothetical protein